jgi:hypothetical protein
MLRVAPKSRRALRRERGPSKPGKRARRREHVGSFNAVGLRRPHKQAELARAFAERDYLCAGISETWVVGTGRNELYDAESKVHLVHGGLDSKDSPARGKWGVGFCLSARAQKCWKQSGQQPITKPARVASIRFDLEDKNGRPVAFSHARGRAMQQSAAAAEKLC